MQRAWWLLGVALFLVSPAWADSPQDDFVAARQAYNERDADELAEFSSRLHNQNYLLAPYVDYWRLLLLLETASTDEVRDFLTRYEEFPFANRVRIEWLKKLGKRGEWQTFFEELPRTTGEDAMVSCYAALGKAASGDSKALNEARPLWFSPNMQPDGCNALYDAMIKAGELTTDDIWERVRLALAEGKITVAKAVAQRIPQFEASSLKFFDTVYENPQRVLEKKTFTTKTRLGRELNLYAIERISRSQPELALKVWQELKSGYSEQDQHYLWGRMALHAARRHDPLALDWFGYAQGTELSRDQVAWKARSALRAKNWEILKDVIEGMPADMRDEPSWQYWYGRVLKETGQVVQANKVWLPLSRERTYYGLLAEEELGEIISVPPVSYKATAEDIRGAQNIPGIQRALELHRLDMRWESRSEWAKAMQNLSDQQLIAAAEVAFREEWYDIAINTAEKTKATHDFVMRYPTPYRDIMDTYVHENDLDEAWVYGLIRQESRFISYARSGVGAQGLMQVMPATAKWIAKRLGMEGYNHGMISQLDTNIQFGTHYLRYALDKMGGQPLMATAAYNAGPSRALRWAPAEPMEGAIYAETIPFSETRNYVQKVMGNAYFYAHRLGTQVKTIKQRLGSIGGSGASVAAVPAAAEATTSEE
jgi:soluble lytic murein transglycosylase